MTDKSGGEKDRERPEIKIVDRRSFTDKGEKRDTGTHSSRDAGNAAPPDPAPDPGGKPGKTVQGPGFTMQGEQGAGGEARAPVEGDPAFINLCVSIFESGCIHLGLQREGEEQKDEPPDLAGARGAISMLEMLKRKTSGNLSDEEQKIIASLLADLQMAYVMKAPGAAS